MREGRTTDWARHESKPPEDKEFDVKIMNTLHFLP